MRLIEKECPNCGAGLSFTKDDTTCKCEYCKREFEIERDTDKKKLVDQFSLSELKTPFKIFSFFTLSSFIAQGFIMLITFIIIIIIAFNIIKGFNDSDSIFNRNVSLIESVNELNSEDYSTIDLNSNVLFSKKTINTATEYIKKGSLKREKTYVMSRKRRNYIVVVYKVVYGKFMNNDEKYTVYVPIRYKNVKNKGNSIAFSLDNGKIAALEYHFDENNYIYGYGDLDTLYNEVIKPYENRYKISIK